MNFQGMTNAALQMGLQSIVVPLDRGFFQITLPDGTKLKDLKADVTIEENHVDHLEITEHPVQQGAMITDHAYKRPAEVRLSLGWSNSPGAVSGPLNSLLGGAGKLGALIPGVGSSAAAQALGNAAGLASGALGVFNTLSGTAANQIKATYAALLKMQESRAIFTLYTGKRKYTNMMLKTLSTETNKSTEHSLLIHVDCKQIIIVNTQTVALRAATQANPSQTASPVSAGTKTLIPR